MEIKVIQIAKNDISRKGMEDPGFNYDYPYEVLFDTYIEQVPTYKKVWAVFKKINEEKPDIINISGWGIDLSITLSIIFSWLKGIKIVISTETTPTNHSRGFLKEWFKKILITRAKGYIAFGIQSKSYIKSFGVSDEAFLDDRSAVVDDEEIIKSFESAKNKPSDFQEIKTEKNFIFVGRLVSVKNIALLLQAFQRFKIKNPEWGLILVGNGPDLTLINEHKKTIDNIYHFEAVSWREVPAFYTKAQSIILCSFSEAWGLVINEAMLCGLYPIVSDACGCADDLVTGVGEVFKTNNLASLENAMHNFASNFSYPHQKSLEKISNYKVETVAKRIIAGFQKM